MAVGSSANLHVTFKLATMAFLEICNYLNLFKYSIFFCKTSNTEHNYSQRRHYFNTFCQKVTLMRQFSDKR